MSRFHPLFFTLVLAVSPLAAGCNDGEAISPAGVCAPTSFSAGSPVVYGKQQLAQALTQTGSLADVRVLVMDDHCTAQLVANDGVTISSAPESFAIFAHGAQTVVVGSDEVGAMYGALEVAERLTAGEVMPPLQPIVRTPDMPIRAGNFFLILPIQGESQSDWWFYDTSFWNEYLDLLARSRLNILDLHGMYVLKSTIFPNALPYFATSTSFPSVGVPQAERDKNVAMLRTIVSMAAQRGIKVGFMTYRSDLSLDGTALPPPLTDDQVGTYTREAAHDLATNVPDLWRLGFRIWESTHSPDWYVNTFVAGLSDSGTNIGLYSRSWGTSKAAMIDIADAANAPMIVEVKYNGEQLGPPYVITGGTMSSSAWWNYSYADYLEDPDPFIFVFQIRSGGTHRLFRQVSFDRTQRAVAGVHLGASQGMSLEATHAFFPVRDDYHASPADRFSPWTFRRDELQYLMFGRLAYDPTTPETTFRRMLALRTGSDALWPAVQAASDVVPWIQSAHTCGPDQRHFAPDLEWGGNVGYWATPPNTVQNGMPCDTHYHGPFDTLAHASPFETATDLVAGHATTKVSPLEVARLVLHDAEVARTAQTAIVDESNVEARDVMRECLALADLGDYFGHKLRAATALAIYGQSRSQDYLDAARSETALADAAWTQLATDTAYIAPFTETMRMGMFGMPIYHWSMMVPHLPEDPASIDAYVKGLDPSVKPKPVPPASTFLYDATPAGPGLASLTPRAPQGSVQPVEVRLAAEPPAGATVNVLWKEFSGYADWNSTPAVRMGDVFHADLPKSSNTGYFAVEVQGGPGAGWRYPDVRAGQPYVVIAP